VANRHRDGFRQAEADLRHSRNALQSGGYEWSSFAAQPAAEKALKAVFLKRSMEAWGHTVSVLIGKLAEISTVPDELVRLEKMLDKHYIPARYPNGFDSGAPTDFYLQQEAEAAIRHAEQIIEFCRHQIGEFHRD
jgi:HEPN domain-containing protein